MRRALVPRTKPMTVPTRHRAARLLVLALATSMLVSACGGVAADPPTSGLPTPSATSAAPVASGAASAGGVTVSGAPGAAPTIAVAAVIVNGYFWRVRASYVAREAFRVFLETERSQRRRAER